jgi:hypothetical protein
MKRFARSPLMVVLTLTLFLLLSSSAFAMEMQGVLTSLQPAAFQFSMAAGDGTDHMFRLAVDGKVLVNSGAGKLGDLQPGDRVLVTFEIQDKEMVAMIVHCTREN